MTVTYSLDHVIATTESVNVEVAEKSAFALQRTVIDPKNGETSTSYILSSGDTSYPAVATYRSSIDERKTGAIRRISVTLATWARSVDSVSGEDKAVPILGTISLNVPQAMQVELADFDDLVGNLFSLLYPSVSAGVRSTTFLSKLLFGISQVV